MNQLYEQIRDKRIVLWGVGIFQRDLENLYSFPRLLYYVEDSLEEKNQINVSRNQIFSSKKLETEIRKDLVVIICSEVPDEAIASLKSMGYGKEHYVLGKELLFDYPLYERLCGRDTYIWGTGGSYYYKEVEIRKYLPDLKGFIETEKQKETFQGRKVYSMEEAKKQCSHGFIVVASIYYKEIYEELTQMGFYPGKDFLHLETLVTLGNLSTGIYVDYQLEDRSREKEDLLIVLAGYKEFVWESVFERLYSFAPKTMDVCIVTSGMTKDHLRDLCKKNQWSYLSTERNNVSLAINLAIWLHPKAKYIYKMDEDIFVTKKVFETLKFTYEEVEKKERHSVGFVSPLIPVNGYGYVRLLETFDCVDLWEKQFGELKYSDCFYHHRSIWKDPKAACFMWGKDNPKMESLDWMEEFLQKKDFQYSVCPIRYSIGFILFHRDNWIKMETFPVLEYRNMGAHEESLCQLCMMQGRAMIIAENAVVGHLAYGRQNKEMEQYYYEHRERFLLP